VHDPFYNSSNIIIINFLSGAGGCALRRLLSLGGGTDVPFIAKPLVRSDGAAHHETDKNSIVCNRGDIEPIIFDRVLFEMGYEDPYTILGDLDSDIIAGMHDVLLRSYKKNGQALISDPMTDIMLIADHMPTHNLRKIFPNAKIIHLSRDPYKCIRYFFHKNLLQSASVDRMNWQGQSHRPTVFDARLAHRGLDQTWAVYKQEMRYISEYILDQHALIRDTDYVVDADMLFESDGWHSEYLGVVDFCGLRPMIASADRFLESYRCNQPYRLAHTLEHRWQS